MVTLLLELHFFCHQQLRGRGPQAGFSFALANPGHGLSRENTVEDQGDLHK